MAQIATITVETAGGPVDLPVYEPGDSGSNRLEAFRVQTASGPGFVPLAAVDEADRPYLRVQTSSGVRAVDTSASGIPDSALTQDLVAWYRFEDGDARDYASSDEFPNVTWGDSTAHDGTVRPNTSFLSSNGVTDFENGSNSSSIEMFDNNSDSGINLGPISLSSHTKMIWFNLDDSSGIMPVFGGNGFNPSKFTLIHIEDGELQYVFDDGNTSFDQIVTTSIATNTYNHAAITYDAAYSSNNASLYLNGNLVGTATKSGGLQVMGDTDEAIGFFAEVTETIFNGTVDDARIYNRALTDAEISDIYNATKP